MKHAVHSKFVCEQNAPDEMSHSFQTTVQAILEVEKKNKNK